MNDTDITELNNETIIEIYKDKFKLYIDDFMNEYNIESLDNQSQWCACLRYIYEHMFKPDRNLRDNRKSILDYQNIMLMHSICDLYISYCNVYKRMVNVYGFGLLTGMDEETVYRNANRDNSDVSSSWCEIIKKLDSGKLQSLDNKLYDSNNVTGQAILVNHYYGYNLPGVSKEKSVDRIQSNNLPTLGIARQDQGAIESND